MARAFAEIAFTPSVLAAQARQGSDRIYSRLLGDGPRTGNLIGPAEAAFVRERFGFYQATTSETGWPYVQFRGGPAGFLKVIDAGTLAYADFRGNRQYISVGNLSADGRVALILLDYATRRRLKVWGVAHLSDDPDVIAALHPTGYDARPERAVVIAVSAVDWNCPQHIPEMVLRSEVNAELHALQSRITELETALGQRA